MKKELMICVIVVVLIIILNIITSNNTNNAMDEVTTELDIIREKIISRNNENIEEQMQNILNKWKEKNISLAYYIEHNELEKVELYLTEAKSNIETEEYNTAVESIDSSKFIIKHIKDKYKFTFKNIF